MSRRRLALLPGDGVGPEVVGAARLVLEALDGFDLVEAEAGFETFKNLGTALPAATLATVEECDGALFGAVGSPSHRVDGYRSPILELRKTLDLYANLRPLKRQGDGQPTIDCLVVRENTEGLYAGRERTEDDGNTAIAERLITRRACERIVRSACERCLARANRGEPSTSRGIPAGGRLTLVHKANVLRVSDGLFRTVGLEVAASYPGIEVEEQLVDSMAYRLVLEPGRYDVVVAPNLYGDILSDLGAALVGGLGVVPSANIGDTFVLAEPVHGSAPDIAGRGIANPIATLRALALLLTELGEHTMAAAVDAATEAVLELGPHTPDLGGKATTLDVAHAVIDRL